MMMLMAIGPLAVTTMVVGAATIGCFSKAMDAVVIASGMLHIGWDIRKLPKSVNPCDPLCGRGPDKCVATPPFWYPSSIISQVLVASPSPLMSVSSPLLPPNKCWSLPL